MIIILAEAGRSENMDPGTGVQAALSTAFSAIAADVTATIVMALPIALGVIGMIVAVKFGIKWFRSLVR